MNLSLVDKFFIYLALGLVDFMPKLMNNQQLNASNNQPLKPMTKQQKAGVVVLSLLTVFIIVFWYASLKKNVLYAPYGGYNPEEMAKQKQADNKAQAIFDATAAKVDSDKDGLTDDNETNLYKTSPYLADTDGDGLSDKEEIDNGTNPNCPEGKDCSSDGLYGISTAPTSTNTGTNTSTVVTQAQLLEKAFGEAPDPVELRKSLLASASDEDAAMINKLTDDQLIELYKRVIAELPINTQSTSTTAQ